MKKLLAVLLALVMVLSMASAFAFVGTCGSGVSSGSCGAGVKRGCSLALLVCPGFAVGFGVDFPGALVAEGFFVPAAAALVEAGAAEAAAGCSLSDSLASWEYNISQSP